MRWLRIPAIVVALIATFLPCAAGSFVLLDRAYVREADGNAARYMPVLVLTPGHIEVMANSEVENYVRTHPDSTFLIPDSEIEALRTQFRTRRHDDVSRSFTVERMSSDRQYIHVECRGDGAWAGWYEATDKAIVPRFSKLYGPGFVFIMIPLAAMMTGAVWFVTFSCYRLIRRPSGRPNLSSHR